FRDAPRSKSIAGRGVFGEGSDQVDRPVEVRVAALLQELLRFYFVPLRQSQLALVVVDLAQPSRVRSAGAMLGAPREVVLSGIALVKHAWQLGAHDAGNPVDHEYLALAELLGLVEHGDGFFHIADAVEQPDGRGMLRP